MLDLNELEQFAAFGEYGTLSRAAEELHISQPTLTRSMRHVEDAFGARLFDRTKNRIELNETGKLALDCARRLLAESEQAVSQVRAYDQRRKTIVVCSCAPAPLWELMKILEQKHPGKTISSSIAQNDGVLRSWESGECDIAVLPFPYNEGGVKPREFMHENLFVCVPKDHELAKYKQLTHADINGFNFLLRSELGFWDRLCRENMPASRFLVQTDDFAFRELIKSSSLPCFTTDYISLDSSVYQGRVAIPIADDDAKATFWLLQRQNFV